ncbi:MAG: hypothetical protein IT481_04995 [Gammaproteobacteria bacterium]|nr:hypothetical protein [Gammaproteobacteria bacterium]
MGLVHGDTLLVQPSMLAVVEPCARRQCEAYGTVDCARDHRAVILAGEQEEFALHAGQAAIGMAEQGLVAAAHGKP